jgi:hypothetical protein
MQPPIIVDYKGDVLCFDSVDNAERYLEPTDIRNNECVIYDRAGRVLKANIVKRFLAERVKLEPASESGAGLARLREVLVSFLTRVGTRSEKPVEQWSIEELLLEMLLRFREA